MITCYIIDDEEYAIEVLTKYINKTPWLELIGYDTNPISGMAKMRARGDAPDLTFLDIDMPELSGIQLAELIHPYTEIIFTTALSDYAVNAFEKDALDYILKPFSYERFLKAAKKAEERLLQKSTTAVEGKQEYFFIQSEGKGKLFKIVFDEIIFIESLQNYVKIHLRSKDILVYLTMKEMEQSLPGHNFFRVHKSYIINIEKMQSLDGNEIIMENTFRVPIGNIYRQAFFEIINNRVLRSKRLDR